MLGQTQARGPRRGLRSAPVDRVKAGELDAAVRGPWKHFQINWVPVLTQQPVKTELARADPHPYSAEENQGMPRVRLLCPRLTPSPS